jgi:hypothetical protein
VEQGDEGTRSVLNFSLLPSALCLQKSKTPPSAITASFTEHFGLDYFSSRQEHTPPSSANSENDTIFMGGENSHKGFRSPNKKFAVNTGFDHAADSYDLVTPNSDDYRSCSPRPWSSSDITSLHPHPPNTPAFSLKEEFEQANFELSVEDFMTLGDEDCAEEQFYQESSNTPVTNNLENELRSAEQGEAKASQIMEIHQMRPLLGSPTQRYRTPSRIPIPKNGKDSFPPPPKLPPQARSPSATNLLVISRSSDDPMAEEKRAAFVCRDIAKNLGYHLVYAVELAATRPIMNDDDLYDRGNLRMKILAIYGADQYLELDPSLHINALRSRGSYTWDPRVRKEGDYDYGRLFHIHAEGGPHRLRTNGIIVGAFRRPEGNGALQEVSETVALKRFEEAVQHLKPILLKSKSRIPQRANTDPQESPRYPANEAREVGNPFSDSFTSNKLYTKAPKAPYFNRFGYNKAR